MYIIAGKTTFFVANQAKIDTMPSDAIALLEAEYKTVDEENKVLSSEIKSANSGYKTVSLASIYVY